MSKATCEFHSHWGPFHEVKESVVAIIKNHASALSEEQASYIADIGYAGYVYELWKLDVPATKNQLLDAHGKGMRNFFYLVNKELRGRNILAIPYDDFSNFRDITQALLEDLADFNTFVYRNIEAHAYIEEQLQAFLKQGPGLAPSKFLHCVNKELVNNLERAWEIS